LLLFTLYLALFSRASLLKDLPVRMGRSAFYLLLLFTVGIFVFNILGAFIGVSFGTACYTHRVCTL
jgi:hypothetical protein